MPWQVSPQNIFYLLPSDNAEVYCSKSRWRHYFPKSCLPLPHITEKSRPVGLMIPRVYHFASSHATLQCFWLFLIPLPTSSFSSTVFIFNWKPVYIFNTGVTRRSRAWACASLCLYFHAICVLKPLAWLLNFSIYIAAANLLNPSLSLELLFQNFLLKAPTLLNPS